MTKGKGRVRWIIFWAAALALIITVTALFVSHITNRPRPVTGRVRLLTEKQVKTATVIFERGSNLTHLAREHYGRVNPTILDVILEANPSITDINHIPINKGIAMPSLSRESFIISAPDKAFTIHLGTYDHRPSLTVLQDEPILRGKTVAIIVRNIAPKERWYRIVAGPFGTKEEAAKALTVLKNRGIPLEFDPSGE